MARLYTQAATDIDTMLARIQNDLFDAGADLCVPAREGKAERLRLAVRQVERMEQDIDMLNARGGSFDSICFGCRVDRQVRRICILRARCADARSGLSWSLLRCPMSRLNPEVVRYLNRLADFLFVASRALNDDGARDVLWVPGANR